MTNHCFACHKARVSSYPVRYEEDIVVVSQKPYPIRYLSFTMFLQPECMKSINKLLLIRRHDTCPRKSFRPGHLAPDTFIPGDEFSLYLVAKAEQWYGVDENPLTSFSNAVWHTFGSFLGENVFQGNIPGGAIASRSVKQNSNHKSCTGHEKT